MKKLYILIILSFVSTKFISQTTYYTFPTDSAEWHVKLTCQYPSCTASLYSPYKTYQKSDTTINGKVYHKMYDIPTSNLYCFYRESSKKIYVKYPVGGVFGNDTAEFVLYNFNINIGDTFLVKVPSSWIGSPTIPVQPKIVLTSTNTASAYPSLNLPNPTTRKVYFFNSNITCTSYNLMWVEGMGNYTGFFYNLYFMAWSLCLSPPAPNDITLTCFLKNGFIIYSNGCTVTNVSAQNNLNENVRIFPNPNSGQITIHSENEIEYIKSIIIKDIMGKEIKFVSNLNITEYTLDLNSISSGVYLLSIQFENKTVNKRLIKN